DVLSVSCAYRAMRLFVLIALALLPATLSMDCYSGKGDNPGIRHGCDIDYDFCYTLEYEDDTPRRGCSLYDQIYCTEEGVTKYRFASSPANLTCCRGELCNNQGL
ncbi:hypothetical protein PMAYCL1PPCAC_25288, partial [Pristionchus mayeri]